MKYIKLDNGGWRVFLKPSEFQVLVEAAPHHRAVIAIKLMAQSLRVGTVAEVTAGQFFQDEDGLWWLHVEAKDATDRDRETKARDVWIPKPIMEIVQSRIESQNLDDDDPIIDVGKRQVQNWVETAREKAAERTGNEDYHKVSSHDFRRFYASHLMLRIGLDKHTVRQMGGWKEVEHMFEYLLLPSDLLRDNIADAGLIGVDPQELEGRSTGEQIQRNFDTIERLAELADSDVEAALRKGVTSIAEKLDSLEVTLLEEPDDDDEDGQYSLSSDWSDRINGLLPPLGFAPALDSRLRREWDDFTDGGADWQPPRELLKGAVVASVFLLGLGIVMAMSGVWFDLSTMTFHAPPSEATPLLLGSVLGIVRVLWVDYRVRIQGRSPLL